MFGLDMAEKRRLSYLLRQEGLTFYRGSNPTREDRRKMRKFRRQADKKGLSLYRYLMYRYHDRFWAERKEKIGCLLVHRGVDMDWRYIYRVVGTKVHGESRNRFGGTKPSERVFVLSCVGLYSTQGGRGAPPYRLPKILPGDTLEIPVWRMPRYTLQPPNSSYTLQHKTPVQILDQVISEMENHSDESFWKSIIHRWMARRDQWALDQGPWGTVESL